MTSKLALIDDGMWPKVRDDITRSGIPLTVASSGFLATLDRFYDRKFPVTLTAGSANGSATSIPRPVPLSAAVARSLPARRRCDPLSAMGPGMRAFAAPVRVPRPGSLWRPGLYVAVGRTNLPSPLSLETDIRCTSPMPKPARRCWHCRRPLLWTARSDYRFCSAPAGPSIGVARR
jgi:hypothetical protein